MTVTFSKFKELPELPYGDDTYILADEAQAETDKWGDTHYTVKAYRQGEKYLQYADGELEDPNYTITWNLKDWAQRATNRLNGSTNPDDYTTDGYDITTYDDNNRCVDQALFYIEDYICDWDNPSDITREAPSLASVAQPEGTTIITAR